MIGRVALFVVALAAGCNHYGQNQAAQAAANVALAATVAAAQAAAAPRPLRPQDRPTQLGELAFEKKKTPCVRGTSYSLYCTSSGERCYYLTSYSVEFACPTLDCASGPPAALARWCEGP